MQGDSFETIIIGGSYAGLSAALTLGRSLRKVLILDSGKPCNRQTPLSHNFLTQDGVPPLAIAEKAKAEVLKYDTVSFLRETAISVHRTSDAFTISTAHNATFTTKKILFATGVRDVMPPLEGFSECWGISVLHCPYCHGYEVKKQSIGILANGNTAYELCTLIRHWAGTLTLYTNGPALLSNEQIELIKTLNVTIVEKEIKALKHEEGYLKNIIFADGSAHSVSTIFSRVIHHQHCSLPLDLGCTLDEQGYIEVDAFQKTSVEGIFAAGDNTTPFRTVSLAVSAGTKAGASINKELISSDLSGLSHPT